jgi:hypothetical protein
VEEEEKVKVVKCNETPPHGIIIMGENLFRDENEDQKGAA